jgi:hypothetical protein
VSERERLLVEQRRCGELPRDADHVRTTLDGARGRRRITVPAATGLLRHEPHHDGRDARALRERAPVAQTRSLTGNVVNERTVEKLERI